MNPTANPAAAVDTPIALVLLSLHYWRCATAQRRSVYE
jgi:hypothetical protein